MILVASGRGQVRIHVREQVKEVNYSRCWGAWRYGKCFKAFVLFSFSNLLLMSTASFLHLHPSTMWWVSSVQRVPRGLVMCIHPSHRKACPLVTRTTVYITRVPLVDEWSECRKTKIIFVLLVIDLLSVTSWRAQSIFLKLGFWLHTDESRRWKESPEQTEHSIESWAAKLELSRTSTPLTGLYIYNGSPPSF